MVNLNAEVTFFQDHSIAQSSQKAYKHGQQAYLNFCQQYSLPPYPLQEHILRLFTAYLARSRSYSTIQCYLSAVRYKSIELGFQSNPAEMHLLQLLLRGIKRIKGSASLPKRAPITIDILKALKQALRTSRFNQRDQLILWASFTTAYFGLLCASEFCCPTQTMFSPSSSLLVEDVKLNTNSITVTLKVSKSDPYRNGHQIRFTRTGKSICPYRALQKHIENCLDTGKPLFAFYSGKFLTRQLFTLILNDLLRPTSFAEKYSSHSFCIGAATAAASSETPEWLLKHIGRWSSSCYQRYIRTPEQAIRMVQKKLATSQVAI